MNNNNKAFPLRLPLELYDKLIAVAKLNERSASAQARLYIKKGIKTEVEKKA